MDSDYFMVNWSERPVVGEHMLVVRQVAVQMIAGIFETERVRFTHDLCEGKLYFRGRGVYGHTGGSFFTANYSDERAELYDVEFFIPRGSERRNLLEGIVIAQMYDESGSPKGHPLDPDLEQVFAGGLRIRPMKGK
jgi:hypothetical protein